MSEKAPTRLRGTGYAPDLAPGQEPGGQSRPTTVALADAGASTTTAATGGTVRAGRRASLGGDAWRQLRRNPLFVVSSALVLVLCVMAARPSLFTGGDPHACDLANSLTRPDGRHWFGFDLQGCDYYVRVVYGARVSVFVGAVATGCALIVAVLVGSVAGYYGGILDALIMRVTDVWLAIPYLLFAIVILGALGSRGLLQVTVVLATLFWMTMLRLMRSAVLSVKELGYVQAARALGAGDLRIVARHILPNAIAPVIVYATITVGIVIASEATLSFLGVGLQLPAISWGLMIEVAQGYLLQAPHLLLFPALFLSVTVLSFILMGDALRDALDPKLR